MTGRPSTGSTPIERKARPIFQVVVGLFFMTGGFFVARAGLQGEPHNDKLLYLGIGLAVFGALVFPGIFSVVQPIYVMIFPNGIPLLGGKRASDPPAPPVA